jgi:hypothetical protein
LLGIDTDLDWHALDADPDLAKGCGSDLIQIHKTAATRRFFPKKSKAAISQMNALHLTKSRIRIKTVF